MKKWALIAQIAGAFAVVSSLLYVGLELNENSRVIEQQRINARASIINNAFIRSPLIPGILAKVKAVDGYEPLEQLYIERYKFTYEEAAIRARNQANIWATLEADFVRSGESQGLKNRIQLLFIFPDVQIAWETIKVEITFPEFLDYIDEVRKMPLSESVPLLESSLMAVLSRKPRLNNSFDVVRE